MASRVNAVTVAFTCLASIVVFFRLFNRGFLLKNVGIEDVCIFIAMVYLIELGLHEND